MFLISFSCLTNFVPAESILFKTPFSYFFLKSFKMMFSTLIIFSIFFGFGVFSISGFSCISETPIPKQWPSAFERWISSLPCCVKFEVVDIDIYLDNVPFISVLVLLLIGSLVYHKSLQYIRANHKSLKSPNDPS
eukprot:NODE_161_length_14984_cov_0.487000.p10 type:complete len:135 gc:universal NODE_161_length_14984_cov_0.487000:928-524(-)